MEINSRLLRKAYETHSEVISSSSDEKAVLLYVLNSKDATSRFYDEIVRLKGVKGTSIFHSLSQIIVKGAGLETRPGVVKDAVEPLYKEGINVYGIVTISSSVRIFVRSEDIQKGLEIVKSSLRLEV
jgi:aspartokinase